MSPVQRMLKLAIDASNIRQGGGVTHLSQLLAAAEPRSSGIGSVAVWAGRETLACLPERPWLSKRSAAWLDGALPERLWGQQVIWPTEVAQGGFDVLFSPGATLPMRCPVPAVTMSQNMLPFEPEEGALFGATNPMRFKMRLLRVSQGRSFRRADGVIFLTEYARQTISAALGGLRCPTVLIPHGIEPRFLKPPRPPRRLEDCTDQHPLRFLYVSILMPYKHQIDVAHAVQLLRERGLRVEMTFVGAPWGDYGTRFQAECERIDPGRHFLRHAGALPFDALHEHYAAADAFLFASSCENLPNILVEAMAAGLPIVSSDRGPMPEVLGDSGLYCDPCSPTSMADAMYKLASDAPLRAELAGSAWRRASGYSWSRCASETFDFIAAVSRRTACRTDHRVSMMQPTQ